jgi:predicted thioesterase
MEVAQLTLVALSDAVTDEEAVEDDDDVKVRVAVAELEPLLLSVALLLPVLEAEGVCVELLVRLLEAGELAVDVSVAEEVDDAVADCG